MVQGVKYWLMAFRPKTLTAALVPIMVTTALVQASGHSIIWWISSCALFSSLCIQIGTNLVNDAIDFKKGADSEYRLGPKRVTQAGIFSAKQVLIVAGIFFFLATLAGIPLVIKGGWPILLIGLFSLLFGYLYTGGPFPLAYKGLGDFFVILFFGVIACTGLFFLHTGRWSLSSLVIGLQIGMHCAVLIAINNLRDIDGDKLVHKKTLPVRFGQIFAKYEIALLCFLPFIIQFYWFLQNQNLPLVLGFLALPLALAIVKQIFTNAPGEIYNRFLAQSAGLHLLFGSLMTIGFFL